MQDNNSTIGEHSWRLLKYCPSVPRRNHKHMVKEDKITTVALFPIVCNFVFVYSHLRSGRYSDLNCLSIGKEECTVLFPWVGSLLDRLVAPKYIMKGFILMMNSSNHISISKIVKMFSLDRLKGVGVGWWQGVLWRYWDDERQIYAVCFYWIKVNSQVEDHPSLWITAF